MVPTITARETLHYPDIRVGGFAMDVWQWRTVAAFRAHLARYGFRATAPWARGVVLHHTYRPVPDEWRGAQSILTLANYYRGKGWDAGPHLFAVAGCPDAADAGIWQLTPLNLAGIHARAANSTHWGLEHVADCTTRPLPLDVAALGMGACAALLDWAGLRATAASLPPHAAYGKPGCPGAGVDLASYRRGVVALMGGM